MRALDGGDGVLERLLRRRAVAAVAIALERFSNFAMVGERIVEA
jgi:hypothetical protein